MENTYKSEHSEPVGAAFSKSANSGAAITPPPYTNGNESNKKLEDENKDSGSEVIDYSNLVNKNKSPQDIKRSRIPQVAYGKERNLMVTFIDINKEGEKVEETEFMERWGHKENVYTDGVLIIECNEKTGVYKETITFKNPVFASSERQMYPGGFGKLVVNDANGDDKTYNFSVLNPDEKIKALELLNAKGINIYYSDFKKGSINEVWEYDVNGDQTSFGETDIYTDVIRKYDSEDEYENWKSEPKSISNTSFMFKLVDGVKEKDRSLDGDNNENAMAEGLLLGLEGVLTIVSLGGSASAVLAAESWGSKLVAGAVLAWEVNDLTSIAGETLLERIAKEINDEYGEMTFKALEGTVEIYGDIESIYKIKTWDGEGNMYKMLWDNKSGIINGSLILMGENPYASDPNTNEKELKSM